MVSGVPFRQRFRVGWADVDGNGHLSNVAILNRAADVRFLFFAQNGFPGSRFSAERVGPVIVRDELRYRKELRFLDEFLVDLLTVGLSPDGARFEVENTFRTIDDVVTAVVSSEGVWFDLDRRRPRAPPLDLDRIFRSAPRSDRFREIPNRPPPPETERPTSPGT